MPTMCRYVKLNWNANCFFSAESKICMNSASCEYRNMSSRKGAQLVPIVMTAICWKTHSPRRPRKCCRLETLASKLCHLQCSCFSNQNFPGQNRVLRDLKPKLCICDFHFLWMKEFRMIVAILLLSFWWGMVVKRVAKSKDLMLLIKLKFGDLRCSYNSFEFL